MKKYLIALITLIVASVSCFSQNRVATSSLTLKTSTSSSSAVLKAIPQSVRSRDVINYTGDWGQVSNLSSNKSRCVQSKTVVRYYTNVAGQRVQAPTYYPSAPKGATARCVDGTYSFSRNRRGTCSHHGGVAQWL